MVHFDRLSEPHGFLVRFDRLSELHGFLVCFDRLSEPLKAYPERPACRAVEGYQVKTSLEVLHSALEYLHILLAVYIYAHALACALRMSHLSVNASVSAGYAFDGHK